MKKLSLAVALGAILVSSASATVIIDDFTTGATSATSSTNNLFVGGSVAASVPGGIRTASVACVNDGFTCGSTTSRKAELSVGGGVFGVITGNGVSSIATLLYDGGGAGLGGFNLAPGFESFFDVFVGSADAPAVGTTVRLTLTDTGLNSFAQTLAFTTAVDGGVDPPALIRFLLQDFINAGVNINSLRSIALRLDGTASPSASGDYEINLVVTSGVPEPGTYALIGCGLLALAGLRLRK